ncbi:hypothetical protein HFO58_07550 [Rhizobium leguminosarum]|uniref:hypothetical protein n=1 Tax=Rhizobium leguminosarum TaxID=384 RepID=UPI001C948B7F|nr:hypothetical protein [Rhizobium leguminosarum]MBY5533024.1 hypothetical protein [Rhizobium leguminosarum]
MKRNAWKIEGAYIPRRLEMLQSPVWRGAPRALKALLEELEIEHMRHRGTANGSLFRSYRQFVAAGFNRSTVSAYTKMGEALGLLKVNRESGFGPSRDLKEACAYTLTYLPTGTGANIAPTDDWRRIKTEAQVLQIIQKFKPIKKEIRRIEIQEEAA